MLRRLALAALLALAPSLGHAQFATIGPTPAVSDNGDRLATTAWVNNFFASGLPLANGKIFIGSAGGLAAQQTVSGDCTLAASGSITCTQSAGNFTVNGTLSVTGMVVDGSGELMTNIAAPATPAAGTTRVYVDSTQKVLTFKNDAGTVGNAVVPSTCAANQFGISVSAAGVFSCAQPAISNISGFGTGVATALALNVGSAGAPVTFNGALGTPSSGTATNLTGLPISTGLTGAGTGVLTALGVNVGSAGAPVVNGGALGTPSSGTLTNATGLPTTGLTGALQAAQEPAHTGDVTNSAGSLALTLSAGNAGNLNAGTLLAARMPALTGDCTTSAGAVATTCTKINGVDQTTGLASYTPTLTAGNSGTIGSSSVTGRWKQLPNKMAYAAVTVSVAAVGTAAGTIQVSLPTNSSTLGNYIGVCYEQNTTGNTGAAAVLGPTNATRLQSAQYAGATFWVNGYIVDCSVLYETP